MSRWFFIFFALFALFAATPAAAQALSVEGIRFGDNAGKTRLVIDLSRSASYRAFLLPSPNRLVVDIPQAQWKIPRSRFITDDLLKGYRSGALDDGVTRIVFDLKKPGIISGSFTLPKSATARDRIVIDLTPSSQNLFNARLEDVAGDRDLKGASKTLSRQDNGSEFRQMQNRLAAEAAPVAAPTVLPLKKPASQPPAKSAQTRKYTIIIDPGHGGQDPGAVGTGGVREKNITLSTARALKKMLEESGRYRVYLTRDSDKFVRLRERLDFSRKKGGDLFISIHADKIGRTNVRGASIYTLSETASDAETARLAEGENKAGVVAGVDLSEESADVADILLDLAMREKMNESNLLAKYLEQSLKSKKVKLLPNSHRSAGFAVLKAPDIPSVLLEIGFLSNAEEVKLLTSSQFQSRISAAIMEGVDAYFRKIQALQKI